MADVGRVLWSGFRTRYDDGFGVEDVFLELDAAAVAVAVSIAIV